ncbi:cell division protein FtsA [Sporosarcina sp. P37]|uniref:cell division protein FtsA n=1 Tax=unclassified Sporosarcina TaxID=2647733 RepID=UPI0009BFC7FC|nr:MULTISPECIES: cell division protein FtsA [unclassified Sporosarcina]ARD49220.1 cell division protein FtsA [Sporosarcina sp. P33]ARK25695.1 cell division protein FtsA [Sporosarcina sp. P37]PID19283.1 cell division protein FtsA [Sporosarcina sp. P35]
MSKSNHYVSLDIGSSTIKVLIGEMDQNALHVIGVGNVQSAGIRKGTIIDIDATVQSIRKAIEQAERMTGLKIEEVVLGIPANGVQFQNVKGVVAVNSENREITDDDLERVMKSSQVMNVPPEREFVNLVPKQFIVDDYDEITDPRGMMGVRLEMDATLITTSKTQLHNILRCVEKAGLQIREIYLQPLAAGTFALSEDEMYHGTAFIDIGGGSTTVSVFAENRLISTSVLPVGGDHITKDLSIVLKTPTEQARMIKHQYGHAYYEDASDEELFEVPVVGSDAKDQYSQRYISDVIGSRLEELFELILEDLYATGIRDLPGGIVITGGTAKLDGILQLARDVFKTRARLYTPEYIGVREPMYSTAVGLIRYAYMEDVFFGYEEDQVGSPQANDSIYEVAEPAAKPVKPKKEKSQGFMKRAKKVFDNFFE